MIGVDRQQFNCRQLVKKDADITTMQFVSFKIDVNEDLFELMSDPEIWPKYILVREFLSERKGMLMPQIRLPGENRFSEPMSTESEASWVDQPMIPLQNGPLTVDPETTQN